MENGKTGGTKVMRNLVKTVEKQTTIMLMIII